MESEPSVGMEMRADSHIDLSCGGEASDTTSATTTVTVAVDGHSLNLFWLWHRPNHTVIHTVYGEISFCEFFKFIYRFLNTFQLLLPTGNCTHVVYHDTIVSFRLITHTLLVKLRLQICKSIFLSLQCGLGFIYFFRSHPSGAAPRHEYPTNEYCRGYGGKGLRWMRDPNKISYYSHYANIFLRCKIMPMYASRSNFEVHSNFLRTNFSLLNSI